MTVSVFNPSATLSGYVRLTGFSYSAAAGLTNCNIYKAPATSLDSRPVWTYLTGDTIPAGSTVTQVEFHRVDALTQAPPYPNNTNIRIGSWIGASLDASAADFNGGTAMGVDIVNDYSDGDYIDLGDGGSDPTGYVALGVGNNTNIIIRNNHSLKESSSFNFHYKSSYCQLRVTWTAPPATLKTLAIMGVGK